MMVIKGGFLLTVVFVVFELFDEEFN